MTFKEAVEVLKKFVAMVEEQKRARKPVSMDEIAKRLWSGDFKDDFDSEEDFKDYMHKLYISDLLAKQKMGDSD